jgi:structural maintenance of chromosome 2
LQAKVEDAKSKHKQATADVKRIEREMAELQNDKGSKVKQIKADIVKKKAEASKLEEVVDNLRNEVLTDELEHGTHGFFFHAYSHIYCS